MQIKFIFLCFAFTSALTLSAQSISYESKALAESYTSLPAGIIKNELSEFVLKANQINGKRDANKNTLQKIPLVDYTDSSATFFRDDVMFKITRTGFSPLAVQQKGDTLNADLYFARKHPFLGTDSDFPHTRIQSIDLRLNGRRIIIPEAVYCFLADPNFCHEFPGTMLKEVYSFVYRSPDQKRLYLHMINGDSSSTYEVTWIIEDGKYLKRVVDRHISH